MNESSGHNDSETQQLDEEFTSIVREGNHEERALLYDLIITEAERLRAIGGTSHG